MKVTLKDCLALPSFARAEQVAGGEGLIQVVKSVSALEATTKEDIEKYASGKDQLMLATFLAFKNDETAMADAVEALAKGGNVGLVLFHVEEILGKIPEAVIERANSLGFPIIKMEEGSGLSIGEAINEITERILTNEEEAKVQSLIHNTIYHLLNFEKYTNFQGAIRAAALANDFQIILLSENFNPVFSVETRHRTTIAEAIKLGKEKSLENKASVYTQINVNGVITYWGPLVIQGEKYFMFIVDNEDAYSAAEITKLAEIIELAMGMWKYSPERDIRAEYIKALRRGNASLAYTLKSEIGIDKEKIISVFFINEFEATNKAQGVVEKLDAVEGLRTISITEENEVYGIVMEEPGDGEGRTQCIEIFDTFKGNGFFDLYHITGMEDVEGAVNAFRLIGETWSFASAVFPYKCVFTKYELSLISNCISVQVQGGPVKNNYMDFFQPFNRLGENKKKQLMETLETFMLDAGTSSSKTAEYMKIHTNTVQYRLRKIDDIMGADITGNRVIPGMTMALALLRLERATL